MDPTVLSPWVTLAVGLLALSTSVWAIISKPGAKAQADVADLAKKIDGLIEGQNGKIDGLGAKIDKLEERTAVIESEIEHLPSRETTHAMELAFRDLKTEVAVLVERIGPIAKTSERLQEFLLSQGR